MEFGQKKIREIDLFDFTRFFGLDFFKSSGPLCRYLYQFFSLQLMDRAIDVGDYFLEALKKLAEKHEIIGDIRGRGMFIGIDLVKNRETREPHIKAAEHALTRFREERILMQVKIFRIRTRKF